MFRFRLSELSEQFNAPFNGDDISFQFVSIDSRTIAPGEAFIAIEGPNFDGHEFVTAAKEKGAVCAIVSRPVDCDIPQLVVKDTRLMLGELARLRRQALTIPVIGITGSCGKTTTKSLVASILQHSAKVLVSQASYNNDFGLPLTILKVDESFEYCVLEMGANHFGEIAYLTRIAKPDVAAITLAAPVHLEGFRDVAGVAEGKGEIFHGMTNQSVAILNADDDFYVYWRDCIGSAKYVDFAVNKPAAVTARNIRLNALQQGCFDCYIGEQTIEINLPLIGEHHIYNALAAAAICHSLGISLEQIKAGLESAKAEDKRMVLRKGLNNAQIFDDSYNASPVAVEAAIKVLASNPGDKILILGDMGELGDNAEAYHHDIGLKARDLGINHFYAYGDLTRLSVDAFGDGAQHFGDQQALIDHVRPQLTEQSILLVKGSRSMKMENIVSALSME